MLFLFGPSKTKREIQAVNDVSLEVKADEILGIIGKNGSGKSTLLRLIAGIYVPDQGQIKTHGSVLYLSGFGHTLIPQLSMKENIHLTGVMMGLSFKETKEQFDAIVEFSGLKEFVDTAIYQFSSGMVTRLAFAATIHYAMHSKPDIILMDEVLGTFGDIDFQAQTIAKIEALIKNHGAVILVSHNMELMQKYSHRIIWIDKGSLKQDGNPCDVIKSYLGSHVLGASNMK
jgi:ABC-type polysaccharide/polyol phosphate transport system ATPase subunit